MLLFCLSAGSLRASSNDPNPKIYVLSIGIGNEHVQYTIKDAKDIASAFFKMTKNENPLNIDVRLLSRREETTKLNIQRAMQDLSERDYKNEDLLVVFISALGKVANDGRYRLISSDYDPMYEEITTIDFKKDILAKLQYLSVNTLLLIDACQAGSNMTGMRVLRDSQSSLILSDLIQNTSGVSVLSSCGNNEYSYEANNWENGAFTAALLEALNNKAVEVEGGKNIHADNYKAVNDEWVEGSDGIISIEELIDFVKMRVPHLVKTIYSTGEQHPSFKQSDSLPSHTGIYRY